MLDAWAGRCFSFEESSVSQLLLPADFQVKGEKRGNDCAYLSTCQPTRKDK